MKPRLWKSSGVWIAHFPERPHRWAMGDTAKDAYDALMLRGAPKGSV